MISEAKTPSTSSQTFAAEDETTRQLTLIWRELLGVASIGPDENYFDLGGDSILAVQLFAQIEHTLGAKLSLATLFDAPTIRDLARVVRSEAPTSSWSSLVPIQPRGSRLPFFCMHGAGGNVMIYRNLARHLGTDQPFYGLQAQGLDGQTNSMTTVEDMAAVYVKEIRGLLAHGPYLLGGYCGGGTIAYEVAQQLRSKGEEVALLALFDSMNWSKVSRRTFWSMTCMYAERLVFHAANLGRLDSRSRSEFMREKFMALRHRIPVWRGMLLAGLGRGPGRARSESALLGRIWQANDRACEEYVPKPYPGVVTDFRPLAQYRRLSAPGAKWGELALSGQEVIILPVYPAGMLAEPFVKHLAAALKKCLDRTTGKISS